MYIISHKTHYRWECGSVRPIHPWNSLVSEPSHTWNLQASWNDPLQLQRPRCFPAELRELSGELGNHKNNQQITVFSAGCCVAQTRSVSQQLLRWLKKKRPWESFTNVGKMRRWFVPAFVSMGAYYFGAMTKLLEYHVWPTLQSTTKSWLCFKTFSVPCKRAPSHHVWGSSGRRCGCFKKILGKYWETQNVLNKRFAI